MDDELYHYGVKGMHWGVRRYRDNPGTYLKRGLDRFDKSESNYNKAKAKQNELREHRNDSAETKSKYRYARGDAKRAKRSMNREYKQLKREKLTDEGKELYKRGETIRGVKTKTFVTNVAISIGDRAVRKAIYKHSNNLYSAMKADKAIALGSEAVQLLIAGKSRKDVKRLRAYYNHTPQVMRR